MAPEYYFLKTGTMATDVNIPGSGHVGADGSATAKERTDA